jgi:hypothetical protein
MFQKGHNFYKEKKHKNLKKIFLLILPSNTMTIISKIIVDHKKKKFKLILPINMTRIMSKIIVYNNKKFKKTFINFTE